MSSIKIPGQIKVKTIKEGLEKIKSIMNELHITAIKKGK